MARQRHWRNATEAESQARNVAAAVEFAGLMRETSAGYRRRLARAGMDRPIGADCWNELPVVDKTDFREDPQSWYASGTRRRHITWKATSGSTGEPFLFPHTEESQIAESVANELNLLAVGWEASMRRATVKIEPKQPGGLRGLVRRLTGRREIGFAASKFRSDQVPGIVETLLRERVSYLRGYSSAIYLLADEVQRLGLSCPLRLVTTLGEGLNGRQAAVVEAAFGARVFRDYGATEAMHVGFECPARRGYHVDLARFRVELLKDGVATEPGDIGDVVVTAFRNAAMPLVRYRIGDVARWAPRSDGCACGNNFPLLAQIEGRVSEVITTPAGAIVSVPQIVAILQYGQEHIVHFKVIQKDPRRYEVVWVARHDRASEHLSALNRKLVDNWNGELEFTWRQVDEIPAESSGKRRVLVPLR